MKTYSVDVLLSRPDRFAQRCVYDERLTRTESLFEGHKQPHEVRHHPTEKLLSTQIQVGSISRKTVE